ncbi:hypothetical protein CI105_08250 [Candidatus Izimaplasma bacterium ZiA1]|uniref:hypothetical protein n=1 Tax=Candidatus Izimoplasma sp. ZiA1 TaxID=2024899 RepID=UPI000BAA3FB0|nr:hypothetical protein CI105_08250 [Candidatus Izimaplasma bacterium ZiA1]
MISASYIKLTINDLTSDHILYKDDNSKRLIVIFPGGSNSCDQPVLHYLRHYYLHNNSDVLCLSYSNITLDDDSIEVQFKKIAYALKEAIVKVKKEHKYDEVVYICRSMGNIVSNDIKNRYPEMIENSVYISPTSEGLNYIKKYPGLIISSTNDSYLEEKDYDTLGTFNEEDVMIFEGATHSLSTDDVFETIDICKMTVSKIINYIENL